MERTGLGRQGEVLLLRSRFRLEGEGSQSDSASSIAESRKAVLCNAASGSAEALDVPQNIKTHVQDWTGAVRPAFRHFLSTFASREGGSWNSRWKVPR